MHAFVNDLQRPVGTYLYGRRMYDTMRFWETAPTLAGQPPCMLDFDLLDEHRFGNGVVHLRYRSR